MWSLLHCRQSKDFSTENTVRAHSDTLATVMNPHRFCLFALTSLVATGACAADRLEEVIVTAKIGRAHV